MKRITLIFNLIVGLVMLAQAHVVLETRFTGKTYEPGETIIINWSILVEHDQIDWGLYFSKDGGDNWEPIEEGLPLYQLTYNWEAPQIESSKMLIQVIQNNDMTEDYFDKSDTFSIHSDNTTPVLNRAVSDLKITVGPNPIVDQAHIFVQSPLKALRIKVYNMHGQMVEELGKFSATPFDQTYNWDIKNLRAGLYFLKAEGDGRTKIVPIFIGH